jgi:hypothetical protein
VAVVRPCLWAALRGSGPRRHCSEVGGIDRRTLLLDTGDLVGERGSTDLMVEPLTALTDTRIRYGCTVVQICAERIRPLDPLRAPPTVRSLL